MRAEYSFLLLYKCESEQEQEFDIILDKYRYKILLCHSKWTNCLVSAYEFQYIFSVDFYTDKNVQFNCLQLKLLTRTNCFQKDSAGIML